MSDSVKIWAIGLFISIMVANTLAFDMQTSPDFESYLHSKDIDRLAIQEGLSSPDLLSKSQSSELTQLSDIGLFHPIKTSKLAWSFLMFTLDSDIQESYYNPVEIIIANTIIFGTVLAGIMVILFAAIPLVTKILKGII